MSKKANNEYLQIRMRLMAKGLTINQWAIANGFIPSTVYSAVTGYRKGKQSVKILNLIKNAKIAI